MEVCACDSGKSWVAAEAGGYKWITRGNKIIDAETEVHYTPWDAFEVYDVVVPDYV